MPINFNLSPTIIRFDSYWAIFVYLLGLLCSGLLECPSSTIKEAPFALLSAGSHGPFSPGPRPPSPPRSWLQPAQGPLHLSPLLCHWLCPLSCSLKVDGLNQYGHHPQVARVLDCYLSILIVHILQWLVLSAWPQQGLFFTFSPETMASWPL